MRPLAILVLTLLATPALAGNVVAPKAPLTADARRKIAEDRVRESVTPWVRSKDALLVRSAIVPFAGNPNNPMTGEGPVDVYVKQEPRGGNAVSRFLHRFDRYANRKFSVNVCANGEACVLSQQSLAPQAKLGRAIGRAFPLPVIVNDVVKSKKGSELTAWLMAGGGMSQVHLAGASETAMLMGAGAAVLKGVSTVVEATKAQTELREQAFTSTLAWIHDTYKTTSAYPVMAQAYNRYLSDLEKLSPGATPIEISDFAKKLSINNL